MCVLVRERETEYCSVVRVSATIADCAQNVAFLVEIERYSIAYFDLPYRI